MIIGIGAGDDGGKVFGQVSGLAPGGFDVRVYSGRASEASCDTFVCEKPWEAMIQDLYSGKISAAVRGTLPANHTLGYLKEISGCGSLKRVAFLETPGGRRFILAPVGVDEGWTVREKIDFVNYSRNIAPGFGISDKVAILSGGRYGDAGRHAAVDRSLADAELAAKITGADHCEILIEDAIKDHGIIIAPDGISGNLIFRTLTMIGGGFAHGAPVVNLDRIFVDTSRASPDYSNAILLASALSEYF